MYVNRVGTINQNANKAISGRGIQPYPSPAQIKLIGENATAKKKLYASSETLL